MCGIAGKVYLNSNQIDTNSLQSMSSLLAHRGPDDEGIYISPNGNVGLVNRRLAIQDLSKNGHMPMDFKNKYIITFNGEIYNFWTLRKKLEKFGYKFKSKTDTEVILALYDKYKTSCLSHLNGMFAFAIYDKTKNILFAARDRIGEKPFKYYFSNNCFIFASELKAILTQKEIKKDIDWDAICNYLTFGYCPAPQTGFSGIQKLPPGHYLICDINQKKLSIFKYWDIDFSNKTDLTTAELQQKIINTLESATKIRMISDVPIGAFLSGGVDSSAIVAMMAMNSNKKINTFTIGFEDEEYDERKYAQKVSKRYNTNHIELMAKPADVEILPKLVYQYEEPYADSSAVITYMISNLARQHVTVILNGDGGDENFAGYERYRRVKRDVLIDKLAIAKLPSQIAAKILFRLLKTNLTKRIEKFLAKSRLPLYQRYLSYIKYFDNKEKNKILKFHLQEITSDNFIKEVFEQKISDDSRDKTLYWDLKYYLPDDLLAKVDIASMAVSLEARAPFLDYRMIELSASIPFDMKVKGFGKNTQYKYILKKALEPYVPKDNLYRQKKGFSIPLSKWFSGKLGIYAKSILLSKKAHINNYFEKDEIKQMFEKHNVLNDFGPKLWSLLTLELWFKNYFNN
ncbi:MAG: asparagine synthase (glutamine-hydrolyzing) [Patescibacteria group bacterium]|nr:asparagine synthase (glutamine-hydrolyzing) [Patescibacteria group bacterium]